MPEMLYCSEVRELLSLKEACCSSCHADEEDGFGPMLDVSLPDGQDAELCCALANEIDKPRSTGGE